MTSGLTFISTPEFQADVERNTRRWDDEWVAYWGRHKAYAYKYFLNLRDVDRSELRWPAEEVRRMSQREFYDFSAVKYYPFAIWVKGEAVPGSVIVELGCGPGLLGKIVGHFCERYIGLDYSKLALYLARVVSPRQCSYLHLSEVDQIAKLKSSVDLCVGRFFFIHQNFQNATWVLRLFRFLLKDGGIVSADFYATADNVKRPTVVLKARDDLHKEHPSCVFEYRCDDIEQLAEQCGYAVKSIDYEPTMQRRFVCFKKN